MRVQTLSETRIILFHLLCNINIIIENPVQYCLKFKRFFQQIGKTCIKYNLVDELERD